YRPSPAPVAVAAGPAAATLARVGAIPSASSPSATPATSSRGGVSHDGLARGSTAALAYEGDVTRNRGGQSVVVDAVPTPLADDSSGGAGATPGAHIAAEQQRGQLVAGGAGRG
ncbi:unnamed protein product, partial [Pylaiella littoralis]